MSVEELRKIAHDNASSDYSVALLSMRGYNRIGFMMSLFTLMMIVTCFLVDLTLADGIVSTIMISLFLIVGAYALYEGLRRKAQKQLLAMPVDELRKRASDCVLQTFEHFGSLTKVISMNNE